VPDNVWAVDADRDIRSGITTGPRRASISGIAAWPCTKAALLHNTGLHLISLNAKDGTVRWDKVFADPTKGYWSTMAPLW